MKIGYARVSTDEQNLALQLDALKGAGCDTIHEDRLSGAVVQRPGLDQALAACATGDVLIVWKLDRLGRSLLDLVGDQAEARPRRRFLRKTDGFLAITKSLSRLMANRQKTHCGNDRKLAR